MSGKVVAVAVLHVSRCFGGPEEGGWWYDHTDVEVVSRGLTSRQARRLQRRLKREEAKHRPRYDRFSVLGGTDVEVRRGPVESLLAEQTRGRPHYC